MVQNAAMKPLRRVVGCKPWVEGDPRLSDAAIRQQVSALSVPAVVDIARLRHAGRLALQAPRQYVALIQSKGGEPWRRELRTSMQLWQAMVAPRLDELPAVLSDAALKEWTAWMRKWPAQWQSIVKIFKKKVREDPVKYKCLANAARQEGPESSEDDGFICGACAKWFASAASLKIPPSARPRAAKGGEAIRHCKRLPWMRYRLAYQVEMHVAHDAQFQVQSTLERRTYRPVHG